MPHQVLYDPNMSSQEIACKRLQFKGPGRAMYAYLEYKLGFESAINIPDEIPKTNLPGPGNECTVPWIVEAPLNSVEILEALLKPARPLQIYTDRHVPRRMITTDGNPKFLKKCQRIYQEFVQSQGRLTEDREISYVCIPDDAIHTLRERLLGRISPVQLCYISIPYSWRDGDRTLAHPWAFVLHHEPMHQFSYQNNLERLLVELNLAGCGFKRSLLKPGTTPLPECLWDWYVGIPGKNAALPYYAVDTGSAAGTGSSRIVDKENKDDMNEATDHNPKIPSREDIIEV